MKSNLEKKIDVCADGGENMSNLNTNKTHALQYNVSHCTVLYCTVLYCTVLYCTVLYCTVLYCTVLYCTLLYCTACGCIAYLGLDSTMTWCVGSHAAPSMNSPLRYAPSSGRCFLAFSHSAAVSTRKSNSD